MFNSISLQLAFHCSILLQYTMCLLSFKQRFETRKEMRKNYYNLFKKHFFILSFNISDTTSILLVGIDRKVASIHWYFRERFSELSYQFF